MWRGAGTTPRKVSASPSPPEARWVSGKLRICACANFMSSIVCEGTLAMSARISSSDRRKLGGDHLSKRSENSRTATSPRALTSPMIASTAARVLASLSSCWPASAANLIWRGMRLLLLDDLVGLRQERRWDCQADRARCLDVDDQSETCSLIDRNVACLGTAEDRRTRSAMWRASSTGSGA